METSNENRVLRDLGVAYVFKVGYVLSVAKGLPLKIESRESVDFGISSTIWGSYRSGMWF